MRDHPVLFFAFSWLELDWSGELGEKRRAEKEKDVHYLTRYLIPSKMNSQ